MAIIYTYPTKATPALEDLVLISDSADGNKSKNATIASLKQTINNVVDSFNSLTGDVTITGGTNVTLTTSGNNIQIDSSGGGDTYTLEAEAKSGGANLLLNAATGSDSTVSLTQGSGITITRDNSTSISISSSGNSSGFETLPFTTANGYITATGTYVFQMIAPSNCAPENFKFYNLLAQVEERTVAVAIYKGDLDVGGSLQSTGEIAGVLSSQISGSTLTVLDSATAISAGDDILVCLSFDSNISPLGVIPITAVGEVTLANESPVSNEKLALFDTTSITASEFPITITGLVNLLGEATQTKSRPFLLIY